MEENQPVGFQLSRVAASERSFLSQVYFWMAMGLLLTGFVAGWMAQSPSLIVALMRNTVLFFVLALSQLGIVLWLSSQIAQLSLTAATAGFSIYATLNGILFSTLFLVYTGASIASSFVVTAGTFGFASVYGFTTKRDLSSAGSFLFMALVGMILASLVNWLLKSPVLYWIITYAGIAIFIGLTAYDTHALKKIHAQGFSSHDEMKKVALLGALKLYLDFINLFLLLLRVMGRKR